jgi:hypothetical protein
MILDFCLSHRDHLDRAFSHEALDHNERLLEAKGAPLGVETSQLHAVLTSSLLESVAASGERGPRLERIREPNRAEYARLISKGRLLYEHCMTEVSNACVVGFMHHELTKTRKAERVILDLLGWMVAQRFDISELVDDEGDEALRRCAHTDYMIDQGVSFLHGLDRAAASALAADREPID